MSSAAHVYRKAEDRARAIANSPAKKKNVIQIRHGADIAVLCQTLAIQSRAQAQQLVDRYFLSPAYQATYRLPRTLESLFGR